MLDQRYLLTPCLLFCCQGGQSYSQKTGHRFSRPFPIKCTRDAPAVLHADNRHVSAFNDVEFVSLAPVLLSKSAKVSGTSIGAVTGYDYVFTLIHGARWLKFGVRVLKKWGHHGDPPLPVLHENADMNMVNDSHANVYGHTTLNTPVLVRSPKLSNVGPG